MRPTLNGRGFATLLVMLVIAIASVVIVVVQTAAYTEAMTGREALARVRAHWAARAGVEATLASLEFNTQNPEIGDAFTLIGDMADVSEGEFSQSLYRVSHTADGKEILGPADAHAKLNINLMTRAQLLNLPLMSEDVADAILDWIDPDDDTNPLGAEIGFYASLPYPYEPRNGPMRSIEELELVAGVYPDFVRGEDANLNGLLDPEEDDGDASFPPDNADGKLDAGWAAILTASSIDDVMTPSGQARLDLRTASEGDVAGRADLDADQAKIVVDYAAQYEQAQMQDFIRSNLGTLVRRTPGTTQEQARAAGRSALTDEQIARLLDEAMIGTPAETGPRPGKLNLNTAPAEVLQHLFPDDVALADSILFERESRPDGFTSLVDLLAIPSMSRGRLAGVYPLLTVRSNVFTVTCRGRDLRTGLEVEMIATLDRSSLPVVIKDLRVR
ncbi:MAG: type II secretion system protein GspK [Phycisphaerales bacterium]